MLQDVSAAQSTFPLQLSSSQLMTQSLVPRSHTTSPTQLSLSQAILQLWPMQVVSLLQVRGPMQLISHVWTAPRPPQVTGCRQLSAPRQLI